MFRVYSRKELLIMRLTVVTEDEAVVNVDVRLLSCCAWRGTVKTILLCWLIITTLRALAGTAALVYLQMHHEAHLMRTRRSYRSAMRTAWTR